MTNLVRCDGCGAPRSHAKCDYCGSVHHWSPVNEDWARDLNTMGGWGRDVGTQYYDGPYTNDYDRPRRRRRW